MAKRIATRQEKCTFTSLRRWNPGVPEEVLAAEARHRFEASLLKAHEGGELQTAIATRLGYSLTQVERILKSARRTRAAGTPSPLDAWSKPATEPKAACEAKPAPAQDAFLRSLVEMQVENWASPNADVTDLQRAQAQTLVERAKREALERQVEELKTAKTASTTHVAGEDWVRSVHRSATGVVVKAKPPAGEVGPTLRLELSDASARWLGGHVLAALDVKRTDVETKLSQEPPPEPMVRIIDGMLAIESAKGSSGFVFSFKKEGVRLSHLSRLLSKHA
jgi:hypothetical protein